MSEPLHPQVSPSPADYPSALAPALSPAAVRLARHEEPVRIGLALSGGATKAVAHVGVLKALAEAGIVIESITGTSGGSIVGALYASGRTVADLEQIALSMSWKHMAQVSLSRLGFLSSDKIERYLISVMGDITFEDLTTPLAVIATNLVTGRAQVFREGRVALACRASCSIPQVYNPVEIDGQFFVDGGIVEELPLATLRAQFAPSLAVGVNLVAAHVPMTRPRHLFHMAWHLGVIVSRQSATASEHLADVIVRPQLHSYSGLHFRRIPEMMEEGYRAGQAAALEIRALAAARRAALVAGQVAHPGERVRPKSAGPAPIVLPPSGA